MMLILALGGCGKDNSTAGTPGAVTPTTITDLSTITQAADRRALVGRKVEIPNAQAQQVVGTYVFWAGDTHSAVPVVRLDRMRGPVAEHVKRGAQVGMSGTVRLLSSVSATDPLWTHVNERERNDMLGAIVYIAADNVLIVH